LCRMYAACIYAVFERISQANSVNMRSLIYSYLDLQYQVCTTHVPFCLVDRPISPVLASDRLFWTLGALLLLMSHSFDLLSPVDLPGWMVLWIDEI
jgi:hypothetical protein